MFTFDQHMTNYTKFTRMTGTLKKMSSSSLATFWIVFTSPWRALRTLFYNRLCLVWRGEQRLVQSANRLKGKIRIFAPHSQSLIPIVYVWNSCFVFVLSDWTLPNVAVCFNWKNVSHLSFCSAQCCPASIFLPVLSASLSHQRPPADIRSSLPKIFMQVVMRLVTRRKTLTTIWWFNEQMLMSRLTGFGFIPSLSLSL